MRATRALRATWSHGTVDASVLSFHGRAGVGVGAAADPLPLAVAILARARAGVDPARFMQLLREHWGGDLRDVPPSTAFLRAFPAIFAVETEERVYSPPAARGTRHAGADEAARAAAPRGRYGAIKAVRLTRAAEAVAAAAADAAVGAPLAIPLGSWPPAAIALLKGFAWNLLPCTTARPCPCVRSATARLLSEITPIYN